MLTTEQRAQIEAEGASQVKRHWSEPVIAATGRTLDDIRHKVWEEGWYGRQVTGNVQPVRQATAEEIYGRDAASAAVDLHASTERDIHGNPLGRDAQGNLGGPALHTPEQSVGGSPARHEAEQGHQWQPPEAGR